MLFSLLDELENFHSLEMNSSRSGYHLKVVVVESFVVVELHDDKCM